jgi:hypothetical protein
MEYIDASIGFEITPAVILGISGQTLKQTFGDVSPPTPIFGSSADVGSTAGSPVQAGTGGVPATARHNRGMLSMSLFF